MRKNRYLDRKFNDSESNRILWDKGLFNNYFQEFINRQYLYIDNNTTEEELKKFYKSLKGYQYIVKPNDLYYGQGISTSDSYEDLLTLRNQGLCEAIP